MVRLEEERETGSSRTKRAIRLNIVVTLVLLVSLTRALGQDVEFENLARSERLDLARCFSDTLTVARKHKLAQWLSPTLQAVCAVEIERVKSAAERDLKDEFMKKWGPGQLAYGMLWKALELYKEHPVSPCSGTGCSLANYRACLMRRMPSAINTKRRPADFERLAQEQCHDSEGATRAALSNDFDNVMKSHFARGLNHTINDLIRDITTGTRREVVALYAEDLVKVQPGRRSCRPEMCGASPCLSLVEKPSEYECVIDQK